MSEQTPESIPKAPTFEELQQELGVVEPGPPELAQDLSGETPSEE